MAFRTVGVFPRGLFDESLGSLESNLHGIFDSIVDSVQGTETQQRAAKVTSDGKADFVPRFAVAEDEREILFECELPGTQLSDIEITLEKDTLKISGEKKKVREQYTYATTQFGKFALAIRVGEEVDSDSVKASLKDGLLSVRLAKKAVISKKKIEIQTH